MSHLPASIPRAVDLDQFVADPLAFLARSRSELGDAFVLQESGPIFSRARDCNGVVAVFGAQRHRQVLQEMDSFAMPVSAAQEMSLPASLVNLNCGLHSKCGDQHADQKRLVMNVLGPEFVEAHQSEMRASIDDFAESWKPGMTISLLSEMRRLTLDISSRIVLGRQCPVGSELGLLMYTYFSLRRDASSPFRAARNDSREELISIGHRVDETLRQLVRQYRERPCDARGPLLQRIATLGEPGRFALTEDEVVGHANVLFVSSTEPIAVSLVWFVLVLSQLPELRQDLRAELANTTELSAAHYSPHRFDWVINETLRLLTPNALMVRLTSRPVSLQGEMLPAQCEIVLCPFLAHRDTERFPDPDVFIPSRWEHARPSPYEYFPFGAGGHVCAGRSLALWMIKSALGTLTQRFDLVLASSQAIDWRVQIMLMPHDDPVVAIHRADTRHAVASPRWRGPVSDLIRFRHELY